MARPVRHCISLRHAPGTRGRLLAGAAKLVASLLLSHAEIASSDSSIRLRRSVDIASTRLRRVCCSRPRLFAFEHASGLCRDAQPQLEARLLRAPNADAAVRSAVELILRARSSLACVRLLLCDASAMDHQRLLSDASSDMSRPGSPHLRAQAARRSSRGSSRLGGFGVSVIVLMLLLVSLFVFSSPHSHRRWRHRQAVAMAAAGCPTPVPVTVTCPAAPAPIPCPACPSLNAPPPAIEPPARVEAPASDSARVGMDAPEYARVEVPAAEPARIASPPTVDAHPLSCDASAACRRAREIAVSSWSQHPIPPLGHNGSDYSWAPFVQGRRWELAKGRLTDAESMVWPSVVAKREDAMPAIPRVVVQTWREEVRLPPYDHADVAAPRPDHLECRVELAREELRVRLPLLPGRGRGALRRAMAAVDRRGGQQLLGAQGPPRRLALV